jgi:hypothetical protein
MQYTPARFVAINIICCLLICCTYGCRGRSAGSAGGVELEPGGEPFEYAATVVRSFLEGDSVHELSVTRVFRLGELRREEWVEEGQSRALIERPDLGTTFLLDLDQWTYREIPIINDQAAESEPEDLNKGLGEMESPERVETRRLDNQRIDRHDCAVYETRAVYPDSTTEVTRIWRAKDPGIDIRVEITGAGNRTYITERRDLVTSVDRAVFEVPAGFRKR